MPKIVRVDPWLPHSARPSGTVVDTVVLHHTGGASAESTIRWLRGPWSAALNRFMGRSASYHAVFERDGTCYKCVPLSQKAWHAGRSNGPHGPDVNRYSVGIALANRGNGEEYPEAQLMACASYIRFELPKQFSGLEFVTTHRLITGRKVDPAHFGFIEFCDSRLGDQLAPWMDEGLGRPWDG